MPAPTAPSHRCRRCRRCRPHHSPARALPRGAAHADVGAGARAADPRGGGGRTGGAAPALLSPTGTAIFGAVAEPTAPQSNTPEFNNVQLWKDGFHQGMAPDTALPPGARAMPGMAAMPPATPAANPSPKLMVTPTPLKVANMLAAPLDLAHRRRPRRAAPSVAGRGPFSSAAPAPQIPAPAARGGAAAAAARTRGRAGRLPAARARGGGDGRRGPFGRRRRRARRSSARRRRRRDSDAASAFGTPAKPVVLGGGGSPSPPPTSRSGSFSPRGAGKHFREFTPPPPAPEEAFGAPPPVSVGRSAAAAAAAAFSAPAAPADPFSAPPPVNQVPSDPFGAPAAPSDLFRTRGGRRRGPARRRAAPPRADPFHAAPAAPGVYHGGWGGQQPPPSNAFFAAPDQVFESPAQNKAAPRNTASPDLFGDSVAPSTVSSGEKKKAAKNFDFGLHSELVSLDLNANGAPPKAKSAIKKAPAVAMNKMATTERRSSMLSTAPMGMPQPMGIQAHPAFARYTPEQQQWLLAQTPQVQAQYLQ